MKGERRKGKGGGLWAVDVLIHRSRGYFILVEDGVVKRLNVEAPGDFSVSSAEHMLGQM